MPEEDPFSGVVTAATVYAAVVTVGERVGQVDHKVDLVDQKVGGLVSSVADLQTRVRDLEASDHTQQAAIDQVTAVNGDLEGRMREVEATRWPKGLPLLFAAASLVIAVIALWRGW
ncbi:hypothetical protein ACIBEJ_00310 [Nonomuraea sp. NPDC050790]|uniref:hypothetical protein n=1 Tax=Nonomuraea sp. NPDC050790 TaxID=3364371 RepID=UPI0037B1B8B6